MAEKKVEKFLNFGPEWLHNLPQDSPSVSAQSTTATTTEAQPKICPINKCLLADHRYGREEMLALFDASSNAPEILIRHNELYVSTVQLPLALQAENPEDENNRRSWLARSLPPRSNVTNTTSDMRPALGRNQETLEGGLGRTYRRMPTPPEFVHTGNRGMHRMNSLTDYSRPSGRGIFRTTHTYNPDYPIGRGMSYSLGGVKATGKGRGDNEVGGLRATERPQGIDSSDWDNPNSRKDHQGPGRMYDGNWRRHAPRGSFESDGWRTNSTDMNRNRPQGKKLSWRDDEGDRDVRFDREKTEREWGERVPERRERPSWATTRKTWSGESHSPDDLLPEWANSENLLGPSGTFDSSGAFHGGIEDEKESEFTRPPLQHSQSSTGPFTDKKDFPTRSYVNNQSLMKQGARPTLMRVSSGDKISYTSPAKPSFSATDIDFLTKFTLPAKSSLSQMDLDFINKKVREKYEKLTETDSENNEKQPKLSDADIDTDLNQDNSEDSDLSGIPNIPKFDASVPPPPTKYLLKVLYDISDDESVRQNIDNRNFNANAPDGDTSNDEDDNESLTETTVEDEALVQSKFKGSLDETEYPMIKDIVKMLVLEEDTDVNKDTDDLNIQDLSKLATTCVPLTATSTQISSPNSMLPPGVSLPHNTSFTREVKQIPPSLYNPTTWFYMDPQGDAQGPFSSLEMYEWFNTGYFTNSLLVRRASDIRYVMLGHWIELCGMVPFILQDPNYVMLKKYGPTFVPPMLDPRLPCDLVSYQRQRAMLMNAQQNYQFGGIINAVQPQQVPNQYSHLSTGHELPINPDYMMNQWVRTTWREPSQHSTTPSPVHQMPMTTSHGLTMSNQGSPHVIPASHQIAMPIPQLHQPLPMSTSHGLTMPNQGPPHVNSTNHQIVMPVPQLHQTMSTSHGLTMSSQVPPHIITTTHQIGMPVPLQYMPISTSHGMAMSNQTSPHAISTGQQIVMPVPLLRQTIPITTSHGLTMSHQGPHVMTTCHQIVMPVPVIHTMPMTTSHGLTMSHRPPYINATSQIAMPISQLYIPMSTSHGLTNPNQGPPNVVSTGHQGVMPVPQHQSMTTSHGLTMSSQAPHNITTSHQIGMPAPQLQYMPMSTSHGLTMSNRASPHAISTGQQIVMPVPLHLPSPTMSHSLAISNQGSNVTTSLQTVMPMSTSHGLTMPNQGGSQMISSSQQMVMPATQLLNHPPGVLPGMQVRQPNQKSPYSAQHLPSSIWDIQAKPKPPILLEQLYSSISQQHPSTLPLKNMADMDISFKNEMNQDQQSIVPSMGSILTPHQVYQVPQLSTQQENTSLPIQQTTNSHLHLSQPFMNATNTVTQPPPQSGRIGQSNTNATYPYKFNFLGMQEYIPTERIGFTNEHSDDNNDDGYTKVLHQSDTMIPAESLCFESSNSKPCEETVSTPLKKEAKTDSSPFQRKAAPEKDQQDQENKRKVIMDKKKQREEDFKKKEQEKKKKKEDDSAKAEAAKKKQKICQLQLEKKPEPELLQKKNANKPPQAIKEHCISSRAAPWCPPKETSPDNGGGMSLSEIQKLEKEEKIQHIRQLQVEMAQQEEALARAKDQQQQSARNAMQLKWANQKPQPNKVMSLAEIQAEEQLQMTKVAPKQIDKELSSSPVLGVNTGSIWGPPNVNHSWWQGPNGGGIWDTPVVSQKETPQPQANKAPSQKTTTKIDTAVDKKGKGAVPKQSITAKKEDPKCSSNDGVDELVNWCRATLNAINSQIDVPAFISFLKYVEASYEVKEYVKFYLGESKEATEFARQFLEKRSRMMRKNINSAPSDDLCSPAPAINPQTMDFQDAKGKGKKIKKNKMLKIDSRILGFNVTAAADRFNIGHIDSV